MPVVWTGIPGFEGLYSASKCGKIRSEKRTFEIRNQYGTCMATYPSKVLSGRLNGRGYHSVILYKDKVAKRMYVHRAVALAFIPNPNNYTEVNHIDGNKLNNAVNNLEWCTRSHNVKHAYAIGLYRNS